MPHWTATLDPVKRFEGVIDIIVQIYRADSESETGPFTDTHYIMVRDHFKT